MVDFAEICAPKGVTLNCRLLEEVKIGFRIWDMSALKTVITDGLCMTTFVLCLGTQSVFKTPKL